MRVGNWEGATIILKQILEYDAENPDARQLLDEAESNHFWSRMEKCVLSLDDPDCCIGNRLVALPEKGAVGLNVFQ